jgi:oligopeptide transport system substrate-binding protein
MAIFATRAPKFFSRARCRFLVSLALLCFLAVGCFRGETPADITIINYAEPDSLDPAIIVSQPDMRIVRGMFEGLAGLDAKTAQAVPGLAESWEISPDGKTYTFHLRPNLVWSTGEPITADDVVYSWIRALNPLTGSDYANALFYLKNAEAFNAGTIKDPSLVGVHALDKQTVRVELNNPTPFFLDICTFPVAFVVPRQTIEKYGDRWIMARPLPSSGPFVLDYWRLSDRVRLRKNPRYWNATNTQSDIIDLLPISSPNTAFNLYESGAVDIVWDKDSVPHQLLDILLKRPDFHAFHFLGTYFVRINVTKPPFNDPRVRQALAMSVDKELIVKKIMRGGEEPTTHFVPDGTADYSSPPGLEYNPAEAQKLLAEAGYPGGKGFPRFEYTFDASSTGAAQTHENIAVELQRMWHDTLGIQMDLREVETKVFWAMQSHLDYQLSRASWIGDYDDANTFLSMFMSNDGNNRTGWKSPDYDALIDSANEQTDAAAREKIFQKAETMLDSNAAPIIPLFFYAGVMYYDTNKIHGLYPNLIDDHPLEYLHKVKSP